MYLLFLLCFLVNLTVQDNEIDDNSPKTSESLQPFKSAEEAFCLLATAKLNYPCIKCEMNSSCIYGSPTVAVCTPKYKSSGYIQVERTITCQYCYLTEEWEHDCVKKGNCNAVSSPKSYYRTNCTVKSHVICLGHRTFLKNLPCNWTGGIRWSSALLFSLTLGGFGADRFYLGYWQEGIGKLFSFGGLGVWTIIDFVLIAVQYLGPADGSLYL